MITTVTADQPLPDTGGPAFAAMNETCGQDGMTLLDYFAGQVLIGYVSRYGHQGSVDSSTFKDCYDYAAGMIAEKRRRERR